MKNNFRYIYIFCCAGFSFLFFTFGHAFQQHLKTIFRSYHNVNNLNIHKSNHLGQAFETFVKTAALQSSIWERISDFDRGDLYAYNVQRLKKNSLVHLTTPIDYFNMGVFSGRIQLFFF